MFSSSFPINTFLCFLTIGCKIKQAEVHVESSACKPNDVPYKPKNILNEKGCLSYGKYYFIDTFIPPLAVRTIYVPGARPCFLRSAGIDAFVVSIRVSTFMPPMVKTSASNDAVASMSSIPVSIMTAMMPSESRRDVSQPRPAGGRRQESR